MFRDLGLPNAEEHMVKAQLVFKIDSLMKERRMKQADAASLFDVRQPDASKLLRGEFRQFSFGRLCAFSWRAIRMPRSSSSHIATEASLRPCMSPDPR